MKNLDGATSKKISRIRSFRWWRYLIATIIGVFVFASVLPSCSVASSAKFGTLVNKNIKDETSFVFETKSLEEIIANLPTAEEIRAMPLAPHPRLLASEARFVEIRQQIETDATMKEWYEKLHHRADTLLQEKLPEYKLPDGKRLLKTIHRSIPTLALVYQIDKDRRYLNRVWQELEAVAKFPDWNPTHFLDTATMSYAFAIGYDWLYDDWSEQQRSIISSAIVEKGLKPALNAYQSGEKWSQVEHNWNLVCNGSIGIGALAVIDQYPQIASQILPQSLKHLPAAMQHYAPDGAWNEGVAYWHYGTFYNTVILAALKTSLGSDFGLSKLPGFDKTGLFPIYMNGASNIPFNFSDANDNFVNAPELFWLSERYKQPIYSYYQQQSKNHEAFDLLWYKPIDKKVTLRKLLLDRHFRETEVVSMRSEWENPQAIFVGFKAGDNQVTHGNLDLGTFVLDALGVRWATELGKDDYNLPGYFDRQEQRWTYYKTRAEGQNTLVINPNKSPDQNPEARAKIIHFVSQPQKAYAITDLTPAYFPDASKVFRGIALQQERKQILVQDEIQADTPIDLFWFMHTEADIEISKDGKTAMLFQNGQRLWVKLLNPKPSYRFTVMNAQPLPSSPNPQTQDENTDLKKLTIKLQKIRNERLAVLFIPLNKGQQPPSKLPAVNNFSKW